MMARLALTLACAALVTTFPGTAAAQSPTAPARLSVKDAVSLALEHNDQIHIASASVDQAKGALIQAEADALPKLDFSYNYARNIQRPVIFFNQNGQLQQISIGAANDNTFGLTLKQTLFDAGLAFTTRGARLSREYASRSLEAAKDQVALAAKVAYYQVLLDAAIVTVQQKALDQAQRRLDVVRQQTVAGLASEYDSLTAVVAVQNQRPPLIQAESALKQDRDQLKRALGLELTQEIMLTDSLSFEPFQRPDSATVAQAIATRPDVVAQERMVQLRDAAAGVERTKGWPTLSLNVALQRHASSQNVIPGDANFSQSLQAGFSLAWSLFDGRGSQGRLLQDLAQVEAEQARLTAARQDAHLQVQQAADALDAAQVQVQAAQGTVSVAEHALDIAETRFKNGLATQVELGAAELAATQARTNYAQALFQFNVARAQWSAALGTY
jgi:outer membrane protein